MLYSMLGISPYLGTIHSLQEASYQAQDVNMENLTNSEATLLALALIGSFFVMLGATGMLLGREQQMAAKRNAHRDTYHS